jgi:hypothetical protein
VRVVEDTIVEGAPLLAVGTFDGKLRGPRQLLSLLSERELLRLDRGDLAAAGLITLGAFAGALIFFAALHSG